MFPRTTLLQKYFCELQFSLCGPPALQSNHSSAAQKVPMVPLEMAWQHWETFYGWYPGLNETSARLPPGTAIQHPISSSKDYGGGF